MNKVYSHLFVLVLCLASARVALAAPKLISATPNSSTVPTFGLFELTLNMPGDYDNPFDPAVIDPGADFVGPAGRKVHVNAFYTRAYTRTVDGSGREHFAADGADMWKIRFAPNAPGKWRYVVSARDASGATALPEATFTATPSKNPGYAGVSRHNPHAFAFAGERPFVPVGEDMCWGQRSDTASYDTWLPKLHAAGGNWIRIWAAPFTYGLEWKQNAVGRPNPEFHGLRRYNLVNAWKLDRVLDLAAANDVYCMLTLGYQGETETKEGFFTGNALWSQNPYNVANGGPCATPEDFWTNKIARGLYQQRLRYIMARYGWRANIQSWELYNETWAPADWVRDIVHFIKGSGTVTAQPADPFGHLVSTTYLTGKDWNTSEVDFTQTHLYGTGNIPDLGAPIAANASAFLAYDKPHLMAEFGIDWQGPDTPYDPAFKGVNFHNGLWSALASGDAGTAMIWWWDSYIDPGNLYGQLTAPAKVAASLPWTEGRWSPLSFTSFVTHNLTETLHDVTLPAETAWAKAPVTDYTIPSDAQDIKTPYPTYIFGPSKPALRTPLRFHVNYPGAGQFVVHVNQVSQGASLHISLDGKEVKVVDFDSSPVTDPAVKPAYKKTEFNKVYSIYFATFDQDYPIDVPAGAHTIELSNTGRDWMSVDSYRLTNYRSSRYANIRALGVAHDTTALLWIQNRDHNWKAIRDKRDIPTIYGATGSVTGLPTGKYRAEWIDTITGATLRTDSVSTNGTGLPLKIPDLATDIAVRVSRTR